MGKRPLCAICVLFLIAQAVKVSFFGSEGAEPSPLENAAEKAAELTLTGTVYRIEEKAKVTAVFVKDAAVTVYGHEVYEEPQIMAYVRQEQLQQLKQQLEQQSQQPEQQSRRLKQGLKIGNRIRMSGEGQCFESARNPGNFDQKVYYARQGIRILIWPESLEVISDEVWQVHQVLSDLRSSWDQLLIRHLGDYYGGTMSAVLLGEKGGLDAEMKKLYQKNGIGHLLAISGVQTLFLA